MELPFSETDDMKIIVAGSHSLIGESSFVYDTIDASGYPIGEIVSGTASGPDTYGEKWAEKNGRGVTRMPADWEKYGKSAGVRRNKKMAAYADGLIACWDGQSSGTEQMIEHAHEEQLPVFVAVRGHGKHVNRFYEMGFNQTSSE